MTKLLFTPQINEKLVLTFLSGVVPEPPNRTPVVTSDIFAVTFPNTVTGNVLTNDVDPDDDQLEVVSVGGSSLNVGEWLTIPGGGVFYIASDGTMIFDPTGFVTLLAGETAQSTVTYQVSDGVKTADGSVIVTVTGTYVPVTAANDSATVSAAATVNGNVLTNDTGTIVSLVNGSADNVGVATAGSTGGLFTISSSGDWVFDPGESFLSLEEGQTETTTITYTVTDGHSTASATLSVLVEAYVPTVFSFIDPFDTLDTNVWTNTQIPTAVIESGRLKTIPANSSYGTIPGMLYVGTIPENFVVSVDLNVAYNVANGGRFSLYLLDSNGLAQYAVKGISLTDGYDDATLPYLETKGFGGNWTFTRIRYVDFGTTVNLKLWYQAGVLKAMDGVDVVATESFPGPITGILLMASCSGTAFPGYWDNFTIQGL